MRRSINKYLLSSLATLAPIVHKQFVIFFLCSIANLFPTFFFSFSSLQCKNQRRGTCILLTSHRSIDFDAKQRIFHATFNERKGPKKKIQSSCWMNSDDFKHPISPHFAKDKSSRSNFSLGEEVKNRLLRVCACVYVCSCVINWRREKKKLFDFLSQDYKSLHDGRQGDVIFSRQLCSFSMS